jgi:acetylornithine deacetylase
MWPITEKEARKLLSDIIAIDSVNPSLVPGGAGEQAIASYVVDYLLGLGLLARLDEVVPGRPNAVAVLPAGGEETGVPKDAAHTAIGGPLAGKHGLLLNGHIDTAGVRAGPDRAAKARVAGDKVLGLGAFDMKGGVAMGLLALAAVKRSGVKLRRSVLFTGVMDEEYASLGTQDIVRRYRADCAVVMEPTALALHLAHKGFAWVAVETFGRAVHGANHREGLDAIIKMGKVLTSVEEMGRGYLAEEGHPLVGHRSIHGSIIQGGRELSTYPDHCTAQFERRTLPAEDPAGVAAEFEDLCARLGSADPDFRARVTLGLTRSGYEVDRGHKVVETLAEAVKDIAGRKPTFAGSAAWLDSALLGAAGIPTVIFGPEGAGAHAAEEWVSISSVVLGAQVLAETILRICG